MHEVGGGVEARAFEVEVLQITTITVEVGSSKEGMITFAQYEIMA